MSRSAIRRMLFAAVATWAVAMTVAAPSPAQAQWSNNTPLAFGMNVEEASAGTRHDAGLCPGTAG